MNQYKKFLETKQIIDQKSGFEIPLSKLNPMLFDWQKVIVKWALAKGNGAIFADCGLGKTPMQLEWANQVVRKTNKPILILTPLAVSSQTVREGNKFGIECKRSLDGNIKSKITITNYEKLHYFDPNKFIGVICDESSAIKHFAGARQKAVTQFMSKIKYRLLCTATAAPNDYIELGTASEALGQLGHMDMLGTFFKNDEHSLHPIWWGARWRFKPHARKMFWRWVCSWARALRKPSDMGFSDSGFILPPLILKETIVKASRPTGWGFLVMPAVTLEEQRRERKETITERCEEAANKLNNKSPGIAWCHLNAEADLLEKIIPGARQISGSDSDEKKEERLLSFINGDLRVLVTKPRIGGFGLNLQHCSRMTFFPSHSYEQWYQSIRRCWRFGQKKQVNVDIITTEGEIGVLKNLQRKNRAADEMFSQIVAKMDNELKIQHIDTYKTKMEVPNWL